MIGIMIGGIAAVILVGLKAANNAPQPKPIPVKAKTNKK